MPTVTITAAKVFPPKAGKKRGTVVTPDEVLYGAMPPILRLISEGGLYEITYKVDHFNGKDYNVIEDVRPAGPARANPPSAQPSQPVSAPSGGRYGSTDAATAERIFVCGAINAWISNPNTIGPLSTEECASMVRMWRSVWDQTFGLKKAVDEEMGDRIPF